VSQSAQILIVDDNKVSRRILSKAVSNLGHIPLTAVNGEEAIERLHEGGIDLMLLDIEMPVMDGFEVLTRKKDDKDIRDVPTLVVSGLDDIGETAKAIELGAIDFLPKDFDVVIFQARVSTSLERARHRRREKKIISQIEQLTKAAEVLDSDELNPMELEVTELAKQPDAIGNLSRVLLNKATMVYDRRNAQTQQIRNLYGILMLLGLGACFGLKPALARLNLAEIDNPLGVGFYTMGLTTIFVACFAVTREIKWPKWSWQVGRYFFFLAVLTLLPQVLLFWVAAHLPAVMIAIMVTLESFIVFFIAGMMGLEKINIRQFFGLTLGVLGILALFLPQLSQSSGGAAVIWLLLAMCIPACFAGKNILLSMSNSIKLDIIATCLIMFAISTIILFMVIAVFGRFPLLQFPPQNFEFTLIAFSLAETVAIITLVKLISFAGPVFAGQKAYTVATGGVIWSVLLLNETISFSSSLALALILLGLYFVAKKPVAQKLIKRAVAV